MLQHVMSITLIAAVASASPAPSQIRANSAIRVGASAAAPGLMVANPMPVSMADSQAAVTIADGLRERLTRSVGSSYNVVTKRNMNVALATFGFAENELLNTSSASRLAAQLGGTKLIITSTLAKSGGLFTLTARLAPVGGTIDAGHVITLTQVAGQPLPEFGAKAADAILPAVKGWSDALGCINQASTKPDKAAEAAGKAFKLQAGHGLASFCLAEMARTRDSVGPATLQAWQDVVKGDPLSLTAWSQIGFIYQVVKDSAKVIETYQQMLRIAPTNQILRDEAYKLFAGYGRPDAAMEVVEEGIKLDPANTDWYDLKSNVCIGKGDLQCAVTSLEEVYAIDSTRADTNFYAKILYATKSKPDTAKYLQWAKRGAAKYQSSPDILEELAIAYGWVGQSAEAVTTAKQMIMVDETRTDALMRVVQSLLDGKKYSEAASLSPTVKGLPDKSVRNTYGSLLLTVADAVRQAQPVDTKSLIELSDAILGVEPDNANLVTFGSFFLAVALQPGLSEMSTAVRTPQATCQMARDYQALLIKIEPAAIAAAKSTNEGIARFANALVAPVQSEKGYIPERITALCK